MAKSQYLFDLDPKKNPNLNDPSGLKPDPRARVLKALEIPGEKEHRNRFANYPGLRIPGAPDPWTPR